MSWQCPYPETVLDLMGVRIHRLTREQLLECFNSALRSKEPVHFAYLNIAVSNQAADSQEIADLLNQADLVYVDGAGIRLGCRLLGYDCPERNTGADFLPEVLALCARQKKKVGFLGGTPGAAARVAEKYSHEIPELEISLVCDGFAEKNAGEWIQKLRENPPDLLCVGMGVPLQEQWIRENRERYQVKVFWSVGALFEYDGGKLSRCPAWMGKFGLEWFYRLLMEPGRLWKRYIIGNPRFLLRCLYSRWQGRVGMP